MTDAARVVERTYLLLTLLATLAASFMWGHQRRGKTMATADRIA